MSPESSSHPKELNQTLENYNVFCQSCGQIIAVNIDSHRKALEIEEKHREDTQCEYTGTHKINPAPQNE